MIARRLVTILCTTGLVFGATAVSSGTRSHAEEPDRTPAVESRAYLLACQDDPNTFKLPPKDIQWQELHSILDEKAAMIIRVVDRSQIDVSPYIDTEGLRLYVASAECRKQFAQLPRESEDRITLAYLVRNLMLRRYSATGTEPDRVPVCGEAGKKRGTQAMVFIKGGEYVRSGHYFTSQSAELGERKAEKYRVRVTSFYIDRYKVTNEEYCQFLNDGNAGYWNSAPWSNITREAGGRFIVHPDKAKWPAIAVNWYQAAGFAEWAGKRLPTEAEWEFAGGGSAGRRYPWGNESPDSTRGCSLTSGDYTPVDAFPAGATPDGVFGLAGNAAEWCADFYSHEYYHKDSPLNDPTGPSEQHERGDQRRIIRGSSFDWDSWGGDAAYRMRIGQRSNQHPHMGFRVAARIKRAEGVPAAVDPDAERRQKPRDPGVDSEEVKAALKGAAAKQYPKELTIDLGSGLKMEFVLIPAGSFLMGSQNGPRDERPVHRVVISQPFYMAKCELSQGQWEAVMGKDERLTELTKLWEGNRDTIAPNKVMVGLSWNACQDFIAALQKKVAVSLRETKHPLSERAGHRFALPTEAQWEYACRAGSTTDFHFGDDVSMLGEYSWFEGNMIWPGKHGNASRAHYPDVGQKKPNQWGLHDMHGGVWEWCQDWYDPDYYLRSPPVDPAGSETGGFRVVRGGSWFRYGQYARSAYRRFFHPEADGDYVTAYILDFGCRVVINLDGERVDTQDNAQRGISAGVIKIAAKADGKVNYTKLARSLVRYPRNPVLKIGDKGMWDDQTLGCFTVLHDGDQFYFYGGGTQFGKPKRIGMATSEDGIHWTKYNQNPLFPGDMPYCIKVGDKFCLYHPGADDAGRHGLLMRTSRDGFNWSEPQFVLEGNILDPKVVRVAENKFHLYYCSGGRITKDGKQVWEFKAYIATSADGIQWSKEPNPALPLGPQGSWDAASHAGPVVLKLQDGFHMWYLGSGSYNGKTAWRIGHATSPDGLNWTKSGTEPVLDIGTPGAWDGGTFMSFDIMLRDDKFLFWYAAAPGEHGDETKMTIQIGHGTSQ